MDGLPGVGKTMGAKYLAGALEVPLFRLDVGSIKGKYVGESEHALTAALSAIDLEEPAVLLIDEVEKVFSDDHSDVTPALLAALLWWLAEHRSKILTVMTCNNRDKIPPELYRAGRIDETFLLKGLGPAEAVDFVVSCIGQFTTSLEREEVQAEVFATECGTDKLISHADATKLALTLVKQKMVLDV